jgi:hypothetical protein
MKKDDITSNEKRRFYFDFSSWTVMRENIREDEREKKRARKEIMKKI